MPEKGIRDLILFFAFAGLPIVSFWLQDYPDTPFFASMLVVFLITLIWMGTENKPETYKNLVNYNANLDLVSLIWIVLGVLGTYFVSSVFVRGFTTSSIWVPTHNLEMTYLNSFQLSGFWNDVLFQLVLVAPAEELCKLNLHLAFYLKLKGAIGEGFARGIAIGAPIFFWAMLHAYRAYTGPNMFTLMAAAFVGGLIIFAVMYKTSSLMGAILAHAGYNILVLYALQQIALST